MKSLNLTEKQTNRHRELHNLFGVARNNNDVQTYERHTVSATGQNRRHWQSAVQQHWSTVDGLSDKVSFQTASECTNSRTNISNQCIYYCQTSNVTSRHRGPKRKRSWRPLVSVITTLSVLSMGGSLMLLSLIHI